MLKSCSRCGKIHDYNYQCGAKKKYNYTKDRQLRSTYKWRMKSKEIRELAGYRCEVCKDLDELDPDSLEHLEVHHIEKVEERPDLLLDNLNLICLCVNHHKQADNGLIDKRYLQGLAIRR